MEKELQQAEISRVCSALPIVMYDVAEPTLGSDKFIAKVKHIAGRLLPQQKPDPKKPEK